MQPFLTISGVAELMQANGDEGTSLSRMARVRRALDAGAFAGSFKSGANTAAWMIPTAEAKAWIDAACPTPSQLPDHLSAVKITERKMRDRAEEIRAGIVDDGQNDGPDPWAD